CPPRHLLSFPTRRSSDLQYIRLAILEITHPLQLFPNNDRTWGEWEHAVTSDLECAVISLAKKGKRYVGEFIYILIVWKALLITRSGTNGHKRNLSRCFVPGYLNPCTTP